MATYPIPEYLQDSHDGDEWAVAAILGSRVVALHYISEIAPEITQYLDSPAASFAFRRWAAGNPIELRELQALGDVSVGVITANGFDDRWKLADWKPGDQLPESLA